MKHRTTPLLCLLLLSTGTACGIHLAPPDAAAFWAYDVGPTTLDIRPGESDQAFGDVFITFDEKRWPDIRANWWNPLAHLAVQTRVVELLRATQPMIDNQPVAPEDYYATIPGGFFSLIPWRDRINIEVSLHIWDDALRGNDQREMRFSPYWIYRGFGWGCFDRGQG